METTSFIPNVMWGKLFLKGIQIRQLNIGAQKTSSIAVPEVKAGDQPTSKKVTNWNKGFFFLYSFPF